MSYFEKLEESALLVLLGDHLGNFHVSLALYSTVCVALLGPLAKSNGRQGVVDTNTSNIEEHVKGNIVIDSNVHNQKVVEKVAIGSKEIQDWPILHVFVHHKLRGEPNVLIDSKKIETSVLL